MKLLIVEDIETNRKLLRVTMTAEGHEVVEAADGIEALGILQREPVDAIISDILMPKMDGYRLCSEVRQLPKYDSIPFIIYTSTYLSPADQKLSLELGADAFLKKPCPSKTILNEIQKVRSPEYKRATIIRRTDTSAEVMKEYNEVLITKLEKKNAELKRTREELQLANWTLKQLSSAVEQGADNVLITDHNGIIQYVNPSFETLTGYSKSEAIGKTPRILKSGKYEKRFYETLWKTISSGKVFRFQFTNRKKNGDFYYSEETITPIKDEQGNITHFVSTGKDVTQAKLAEQALFASEERYRRLFEGNPLPMWVYDTETLRFLAVNEAALQHYGYSKEEFLSMTIADIRPAEDVPSLLDNVHSVQNEMTKAGIWRHRKKDGTVLFVEISSHQQSFSGRKARLVLANDVTDRKRAEEAMLEAEKKYHGIFDHAIEGIFQSTVEGRFLAANPAMAQMLGYESPEELMSTITDIGSQLYVSTKDRDKLRMLLEQTDTIVGFEAKVRKKDGTEIWLSDNLRAVRDATGKLVCYEGFSKDITERKKAEEAVRLGPFTLVIGFFMLLIMSAGEVMQELLAPTLGVLAADVVNVAVSVAVVLLLTFVILRKQKNLYRQKLGEITERQKAEKALRESEERFGQIAETISEVFWMSDRELSKILYISPAYEKIWGRTCQSLYEQPKSFADAIHPEDREQAFREIQKQSAGGGFDHEYRIVRPDGSVRWIWDRGFPVRSEAGEVIRTAGIAQDITERKKAQQALRESEERFRLTFEGSPIGMVLVDQNYKFTTVNKAFCEMVGYSEAELRTMTLPQLTHADDVQVDLDMAAKLYRSEIPSYQIQKRYIKKNGDPVWILLTGTLIRDAEGKRYGFGMIENIHEKKQAEERLNAQHAVTTVLAQEPTLMDATPKILEVLCNTLHCDFGAIWTIDKKKNVLRLVDLWHHPEFSGPEFEEATRRLEFASGVGLPGIVWSTGQVQWVADFPAMADLNRGSAAEKASLHEALAFPILSGKEIFGIVEFFSKEISRPDAALLQMFSALGTQMGQFIQRRQSEEAKTELEKQLLQSHKIEAIGQLAGGVAHDFNNILMAIHGYSELTLLKMGEKEPLRKELQEIQRAAEQGAGLTRQLLAFSRRQVLAPKVLDLKNAIFNMENMLQRLIGEDVELKTFLSPDVGQIEADPGQIEQILMNLAINSRDAMPDGGKLTIEVGNIDLDDEYVSKHVGAIAGPYVLLSFSDTGHGMDEATLERAFEPFFTTKPEGKGTGLGLSTVYGIVKQSGGYISVYSHPDHGTTFKIYFPRLQAAAESTKTASSAPKRASAGHGKTILLADDNEGIRTAVSSFLQMKGYEVLQAERGADAIELAKNHKGKIDLLISDVVMPEMNGRNLAKFLREIIPGLKILFMSGYTEEAVKRHGVLEKDTAFLSKPVKMETLVMEISELLDG